MPLVATRGAASAQGFGEFAQSAPANYIEDVFQTWLYTGNGSTQTINNGIDLSGKGGMVWFKRRNVIEQNNIYDSARGWDAGGELITNTTDAAQDKGSGYFSVSGTGFSFPTAVYNGSGATYASWTFREQPKFFDVVSFTGTGANATIAHNLGSVPGCIIVKQTNTARSWQVYHRSLSAGQYLELNTTGTAGTDATEFRATPDATNFYLGTSASVNQSGGTYVAYLFAHDAGGFGLTGTDNVISCGSYTGNGNATGPVVTLGYEPQWLLVKPTNFATDWSIIDNMRGAPWGSDGQILQPNTNAAETNRSVRFNPTGFQPADTFADFNRNGTTYIYVAIRRGPMRVPTTGTSVYNADISNGSNPEYVAGFPVDMSITGFRTGGTSFYPSLGARLLQNFYLQTANTSIQDASSQFKYDYQTSWYNGSQTANAFVAWMFRRAPGYFDVVCYSGTGANRTIAHNLTVAPEFMIVKSRSAISNWRTYNATDGNAKYMNLQDTDAAVTDSTNWNNTSPTASVFTVGTNSNVNASAGNFVAYLFASCPGVSKVGSFTGTGATQVINCGFTGGARFVLIKAASTTGNWLVWDSTRGIVAGNDPYLTLNTTASEVTNTDWVDTAATGFELSNAGGNLVNSNGVTYIFLAIA